MAADQDCWPDRMSHAGRAPVAQTIAAGAGRLAAVVPDSLATGRIAVREVARAVVGELARCTAAAAVVPAEALAQPGAGEGRPDGGCRGAVTEVATARQRGAAAPRWLAIVGPGHVLPEPVPAKPPGSVAQAARFRS